MSSSCRSATWCYPHQDTEHSTPETRLSETYRLSQGHEHLHKFYVAGFELEYPSTFTFFHSSIGKYAYTMSNQLCVWLMYYPKYFLEKYMCMSGVTFRSMDKSGDY